MVVEMYLEEGKPLRCLLSESLPYTDTAIVRPLNNATVVLSDGDTRDTLKFRINQDTVTGRFYNYYNDKVVPLNTTRNYSLTIRDSTGRVLLGSTGFLQKVIPIDTVLSRPSAANVDTFSVGVSITDPVQVENYYRFVVARKLHKIHRDITDFVLNDISFNGKPFSFYSEADYAKNDTVVIRVYALSKEHYDYLQSTDDARGSNFNPFSQPGRIKSNVRGGIGIFTAIRFDEKRTIVR
jgi:hypothetical protein